MLKVKNKKVIREIAWTTYRANKKKNMLTIFAIILTTFLISIVMAVGVSYWNTISERQIRMQGMDYDIELSEPREDQVEKIRAMDNVKYAGVAVKCAMLEQYHDQLLDKTRLYWLDEICWEKQTIPALESYEGKYPQQEQEVMLSTGTLKAMGIGKPEIGMKLPVTYFTLKEDSSENEDPSKNEDPSEELLSREFVLCGWYTDYSGNQRGYVSKDFLESTGVKQTDFTQGTLKITLNNPLYSEKEITRMQNAIDMDRNQYVSADQDTIKNFCKTVAGLAALFLMIFASGYLFIYNTLYISISKDIRYYGQLKTVGMTSVQLKRMVYQQAIWNGMIGIPLGLIGTALTAKIIIPKLLHIVNPAFSVSDVVAVKIWVFLIAGCFSLFTNLISCRKPAKMAGDCSPVEALRFYPGKSAGKGRRRENVGIYSMAWRNMFRDKKQAVVIFTSFIIAISVFLVINVIIRENNAKYILNEVYSFDMEIKNETTLDDDRRQIITEDKISEIEKIKGVKSVRKVTSAEVVIPYQEEVYEDYYKELYQSRYSPGNYEEDMELFKEQPDNSYFNPRFIGIDEKGFQVLNKSMGTSLNQEDFENGKIAVAVKAFTEGDNGMTGKTVRFSLPEGKQPGKEYTIKIAAVGDLYCNPAFFSGGHTPDLIVSEKYAEELLEEPFTELINIEYEEPFSKETEQKVKDVFGENNQVSWESKLEQYSEMKNIETQVKVLGNSIGFIIAILAILNYLNMMAASVQNRSKELATLESIGMTTKQIKKMLRTEGLGYAVISIMISIMTGLPISYAVFKGTNLYRLSFSVPWLSNVILFLFVLVICMTAPGIIYQKTQNFSIMERLRNAEDQ